MARFHVRATFEIRGRSYFVLSGLILEGEMRVGMVVHIPLNRSLALTVRIRAIEFAYRSEGVTETCLCVGADSELAELLCMLNIGDETLEVTADNSE